MSRPRRLQTLDDVVLALRGGSSCAVMVEGEEQAGDAAILKSILLNSVGREVTFHGRDGRENLLRELPDFVRQLPAESAFAIVDRDYLADGVVEASYQPGYAGHIYIWRRFAIENYLLEPGWIAEAVDEFYSLRPDDIPAVFRSAEAVERFLLDLCRSLAPQVAGSWVISDVAREARARSLPLPARSYFTELFDRNADWVLNELTLHYSGWSRQYPDLCAPEALGAGFQRRLADVSSSVQTLAGAHRVVNGKTMIDALYRELPVGARPSKEYLRSKLVTMARRQAPDDVREIVIERILPRWRRARGLA